MKSELDNILGTLESAAPSEVWSARGTAPEPSAKQLSEHEIDSLFGRESTGYAPLKTEKPEHRLMLWYRLQGYNVKETALLSGYQYNHVARICRQQWFISAFIKLAAEAGKDSVQTFLEGEVLPALQRTVDLAQNAEGENTRLAANKEILDRFLGKSTVKVESKSSGTIDHVVHDATKLLAEQQRLDEQLRANGLNLHGTS